MKSKTSKFITATIIFALTAVPTLIGELQENSSKQVHYFVRNLGTPEGVLGTSANNINDRNRYSKPARRACCHHGRPSHPLRLHQLDHAQAVLHALHNGSWLY